jgi:hypothetical protein
MRGLIGLIIVSAWFSVFAQSDSVILKSAIDDSTFAKIVREGNDFHLIAWNSADTLSRMIMSIPSTDSGDNNVSWAIQPFSLVGLVSKVSSYAYVVALASRRSVSKSPAIVETDTLWVYKMSSAEGAVSKMFVTALNGGQGPGYSSQEKISAVSFWSAASLFFIGEIKSVSSENNFNSYEGSAIFLYADGSKKEYDVYSSAGVVGSFVRVDSVFSIGPQDYNLLTGDFKVRILTDTGTAYFSGNLFATQTAIKPKAAVMASKSSFVAANAARYDLRGRRIAKTNDAHGLYFIRLAGQSAVIKMMNFDR